MTQILSTPLDYYWEKGRVQGEEKGEKNSFFWERRVFFYPDFIPNLIYEAIQIRNLDLQTAQSKILSYEKTYDLEILLRSL